MESGLDFLFRATRAKDEYINFHQHRCYELVYYLSGTGTTKVGFRNFHFEPFTFAIVEPGCIHDERHDMETEVLFIGFTLGGDSFAFTNRLYGDDRERSILGRLGRMRRELTEKLPHYRHKLDTLLQDILIDTARMNPAAAKETGGLNYSRRFLEEHFNQAIDFHVLADLSGYGYHRFRHLFKEKSGRSPLRYVMELRLERAKKLLLSGMRVSKTADECGFYSEAQFSRIFRRETGLSPREFRKAEST
jgi:AraC family transcriptional activator of pobA